MRKLAVFDLDGTLHHTEKALAPAIARAVADVTGGDEPPYSEINALYGEPLEVFCTRLTGGSSEEEFSAFMGRVRFHQARTLPESGALYPGVKEMLGSLLSEGFHMALLSNAHTDYMEAVTETLGIRHFFGEMRGRGPSASKTPQLMELAKGYDFSVMVGDRYHDVQAGIENGIPAIACGYGYGKPAEHHGATVVDAPGEIAGVIRSLLRRCT